ncbi:MAG: hypothetical protein C4306_07220, partial [Thermoleophilia bacterium]
GPEGLSHPPVLAGLAVQLPAALLAYLVARALLRCADLVAGAAGGEARPRPASAPLLPLPGETVLLRRPRGACVGHGRAPPR